MYNVYTDDMTINHFKDYVSGSGISANLLGKVSSQFIFNKVRWANNQVGVITDVEGSGVLRFVSTDKIRVTETDELPFDDKDVSRYPFVACGFVAYLLTHYGDDTLDIFNGYYKACCKRHSSDGKSPNAWKMAGKKGKNILNENNIEDELALMWESRALLPYFTNDDHDTLRSFCENYIEFMQQKYDQLCGRQEKTPSDMLYDFLNTYERYNGPAMKCIKWLEDERYGACSPLEPVISIADKLGIKDSRAMQRTHFPDSQEEAGFLHNVLTPHEIRNSTEAYRALDLEKIREEIVLKIDECKDELTLKNYVKSLFEPLRDFANMLFPQYTIKEIERIIAEEVFLKDYQKQLLQISIEKIEEMSHWLSFKCGRDVVIAEIKQDSSVMAAMKLSLSDFTTGLQKFTLIISPLLLVRGIALKAWLTEWQIPSPDLDIATLNVDGKSIYTKEQAQTLIDAMRTKNKNLTNEEQLSCTPEDSDKSTPLKVRMKVLLEIMKRAGIGTDNKDMTKVARMAAFILGSSFDYLYGLMNKGFELNEKTHGKSVEEVNKYLKDLDCNYRINIKKS